MDFEIWAFVHLITHLSTSHTHTHTRSIGFYFINLLIDKIFYKSQLYHICTQLLLDK